MKLKELKDIGFVIDNAAQSNLCYYLNNEFILCSDQSAYCPDWRWDNEELSDYDFMYEPHKHLFDTFYLLVNCDFTIDLIFKDIEDIKTFIKFFKTS